MDCKNRPARTGAWLCGTNGTWFYTARPELYLIDPASSKFLCHPPLPPQLQLNDAR
jgi:hypothetical protein